MPVTKTDVIGYSKMLGDTIAGIGKIISDEKLRNKTNSRLKKMDINDPNSVSSTILFLNQTGQENAAKSIESWYANNERIKDKTKKEGMFNALNKFNYEGLTRQDDYRVNAGDEKDVIDPATGKPTVDPFNPEVTYPTAKDEKATTQKWSTIKESRPYMKDGQYWVDRFRSTNDGQYEIVETVNVNDPSKRYNYSQFSGSTTNKQMKVTPYWNAKTGKTEFYNQDGKKVREQEGELNTLNPNDPLFDN